MEERLGAWARFEELSVTTLQAFCARLLREEALEAGVDPFVTPVTAADRLALLLERIDELPLASHDLRGNPSAVLGSIVQRIDRLKDELVTAADYAAWAATLPEDGETARARAVREREFAAIYATHDRLLAEGGTLDAGDLVLHAFRLLRGKPDIRARLAARFHHVLVDEFQDTNFAQNLLLRLLVTDHGNLCVAADDDAAITRFRGASTKNIVDFRAEWPEARVVRLTESRRSGSRILAAAAAVVAPDPGRIEKRLEAPDGTPPGEVAFWRCANERAQAQAVAADVERLVSRDGVAPEDVCVLVRSVKGEGQAVAAALEERAVPYRLSGAAAFFQRAEVRDLLAWLRLLADPGDAGAVVRALARPPIELRAIDLARCTQIARRRKLDMVAALGAALESPQIPPEARERISAFLKMYRAAAGAIDSTRPDLYVHRLIERLGLRRQLLFAASTEVAERLVNLARFAELAADYLRRSPQATAREFARAIAAVADAGLREEEAVAGERPRGVQVMAIHAARGLEFDHVYVLGLMAARMPGPRRRTLEPIPDALIKETLPPDTKAAHVDAMRRLLHVAMTRARRRLVLAYPATTERGAVQPPSPFAEEARAALGAEWEAREEELFGPAETLQSTFRLLRDELLTTVQQVGGRLGELRFDTDLDVSHAVVRYLEVLKLSALMERTRDGGLTVEEALPEINARLLQAATAEQRDIFETSALDEYLLDAERDEALRARAVAQRAEPSLEQFLPQARRRARAVGERHRDLPDLPAQVQVRARVPDPVGADAQPALRDPRPPGARALPRRRRGDRLAARAARAAGGRLAAGRLRRLRGGAPAARQGDGRAAALPRALPGRGRRAGLVRARVRVPAGPAPAARAGRPRRQAARRRLRADRLQDRPAEVGDAAARGRPALALRGRRARVVAARGRPPGLLLRARRREGPGRALRRGPRLDHRHGVHGRRRDPRAGLRADAVVVGVLDVRLPDRLPGSREIGRSPVKPRHGCRARGQPPSGTTRREALGSGGLPRWRRKRWNSRASTSPDGSCEGSGRPSSSSAVRSSFSTKAWTSGSISTARETWRSYSPAASSSSAASTVIPISDSSRRRIASEPFGFGTTAT